MRSIADCHTGEVCGRTGHTMSADCLFEIPGLSSALMVGEPAPPCYRLMCGLLYPGVLGTGILLTAVPKRKRNPHENDSCAHNRDGRAAFDCRSPVSCPGDYHGS